MKKLKDFFTKYGTDYLRRFRLAMSEEERKALFASICCRTGNFGHSLYRCGTCRERHIVYRSCGNRNCPFCQFKKGEVWLEKRLKTALPCPHFMVTFTVPAEIHSFLRDNPREGLELLFRASSDTLKDFLSRDGTPGFFGVLHTWGRQLQYHPHIHYVVAGGTLSKDQERWQAADSRYLANIKAMSKVFRAKMRDGAARLGLKTEIPGEVWKKGWNVNSQAVGDAEGSMKYLSSYVFRPGFSAARFVECKDGEVSFRYRKKGSQEIDICTLKADEFLRRFLQHVLPKGFMKVRYYGFYNANHGVDAQELRNLVSLTTGRVPPQPAEKKPSAPKCPSCGGEIRFIRSVVPWRRAKPVTRWINRREASMKMRE